jgi:hypothetical protein
MNAIDNNEIDKDDILDFLDSEYIDYLKEIDKKHFLKNKKEIEKSIIKFSDTKLCDFIVELLETDINALIIKKIDKIDFTLFKYYFEKNEKKYLEKFRKNIKLLSIIFYKRNLEFNKYVIENIYLKIPYYRKNVYLSELEFIINNCVPYYNDYNVFLYVIEKFKLSYIIKNQKLSDRKFLFNNFNNTNPITSFEELQLVLMKLHITKEEFESSILNLFYLSTENSCSYLTTICRTGDIDLFIKIINNYKISILGMTALYVIEIFVEATKSNNTNFIIILLNYLKNKGLMINKIHYTEILKEIFKLPNYLMYHDIITGFIELGGIVNLNNNYKEYADSIKKL